MLKLSPTAEQTISELAQRHGFSREAVTSMLESVVNGNGTMAQFNHPEFGGSGQWMGGGMTMVSDMFNNSLKARIGELCSELSRLVANDSTLARGESLFVSQGGSSSRQWWPAELGTPTSSGAQNDVRYAHFAQARRLAIEANGRVTVYDTLDHQLGGFSQQQSRGSSLSFHSQHGLIDVASLPIVSDVSQQMRAKESTQQNTSASSPPAGDTADVLATIEKLADLRAKGILSEEEYAAKKAELLRRL